MIGQPQRLIWSGGEHYFRFDIGHLRALEQRLDAGSAAILLRLLNGTWKVDDIIETLRLGLQGGGMDEREAMRAIEKAYPTSNLYELSVVAANVLSMFVAWKTGPDEDVPEDDEKKATAATTESPSPGNGPDGATTSAPLQ